MANALPIVCYPAPKLQRPAAPLEKADLAWPEIQQLIANMAVTMEQAQGIGIAAPQVSRSIRLALVKTKNGPLVLVNPKVTRRSWRQEIESEGCLSIPGVFGLVRRPKKISVRALGQAGQPLSFTATGLFARVIQHEIDHLDGILFIDRAVKITEGQDILAEYEAQQNRR